MLVLEVAEDEAELEPEEVVEEADLVEIIDEDVKDVVDTEGIVDVDTELLVADVLEVVSDDVDLDTDDVGELEVDVVVTNPELLLDEVEAVELLLPLLTAVEVEEDGVDDGVTNLAP